MWSGLQGTEERTAPGCASRIRPFAPLFRVAVLGVLLAVGMSPAWSADDYLSELAVEAEKVDEHVIDPDAEAAKGDTGDPEGGDDAARAEFEKQLKEHYLGSYGFYRKLPERSRQEVFEEYRAGAGMDKIRKTIINRLLHH